MDEVCVGEEGFYLEEGEILRVKLLERNDLTLGREEFRLEVLEAIHHGGMVDEAHWLCVGETFSVTRTKDTSLQHYVPWRLYKERPKGV